MPSGDRGSRDHSRPPQAWAARPPPPAVPAPLALAFSRRRGPKRGGPSPFAPVRTSTRQTSSCRESRHRAAVVEARPRAARRHVVRRPSPPLPVRLVLRHRARAAAPPITAPAPPSQLDDGEQAPSREHVVAATERRRPRRATVDRSVGRRVSPHDLTASFRRRHHARAAALPTTAPAPPGQLDEGERAQRRERVVLQIGRRRPRCACADLAVGNPRASS